jgi:hypothetical protein
MLTVQRLERDRRKVKLTEEGRKEGRTDTKRKKDKYI